VKASTETDADAHDRAGDSVRVDAADLRCRVVGEGGNLGFTQRARIEYARAGGRINADFIDNSAGVDCSDHEVNLKILTDVAVRRGALEESERNALLREVTADVVEHVLYDSFLQAQILGQETEDSASRIFAYEDLMQQLEAEGLLVRAAEFLPATEEMGERRRSGEPMVRPELAVLLSYAKRSVAEGLLESRLIDDPYFHADLAEYFPARVSERFGELLDAHPLRRELVATLLANSAVDALGVTWVSRRVRETGAPVPDVVRAYRVARDVSGAEERWAAIERLGWSVEREAQAELMAGVDRLVESLARWYLLRGSLEGEPLAEVVERDRAVYDELARAGWEVAGESWRLERSKEIGSLYSAGVPETVARAHAGLELLRGVPDVGAVARASGAGIVDVGRVFFGVGDALRITWLEGELGGLPGSTRWQRWALAAVRDDLQLARREVSERVVALMRESRASPDEALAQYLEERGEADRRLQGFMRALAAEGVRDLAVVTVAVRQIRAMVS
jgi:glutamate dehydrogenase